jgi:hypothetical protein
MHRLLLVVLGLALAVLAGRSLFYHSKLSTDQRNSKRKFIGIFVLICLVEKDKKG